MMLVMSAYFVLEKIARLFWQNRIRYLIEYLLLCILLIPPHSSILHSENMNKWQKQNENCWTPNSNIQKDNPRHQTYPDNEQNQA